MTEYPRDEFDKVPESSARQGVHRERLIPAGSNGLGLKITVGILALLIGLGAYFILPRLGFASGTEGASATSATSAPAVGSTPSASASGAVRATVEPSPSASGSPSAQASPSASASASASPEATSGASESAEPTDQADPAQASSPDPASPAVDEGVSVMPDRTQAVNVLNGTGFPGLASAAAGRLASAGWTSAFPGNWAGAPVDTSVVFYSGEAQRASAEAVAVDLGIASLVDSPAAAAGISVVLGPGFQ